MAGFAEQHHDVDGIDSAVLSAGEGEPLVFLHGGGILEGFDCFLPLAERFRLIVPFHPGFGPSADDPSISSIQDYASHYDRLFDVLGLDRIVLTGHSLGGYLAAAYAVEHGDRISRLVLASPFGVDVPGHPPTNLGEVPPNEIFGMLSGEPSVWEGRIPDPPDEEFIAARGREGASAGRVVPGPYDPELAGSLDRLTMPVLLLWGAKDRIIPAEHAPEWEKALPDVRSIVYPGRGHLLFHEEPRAVRAILEFA
jgi:pimeloyl-ACP methyl ester carboxylesterase